MIWCVIWTCLMLFWLFFGCYSGWNPATPNLGPLIGSTIIPWACVLILGLVLFGGITVKF